MGTPLSFERRYYVSQQPGLVRTKFILDSLPVGPGIADMGPSMFRQEFHSRSVVQTSTWKPQYYAILAVAIVPSDIGQIFQGLDTDTWENQLFPQAGIGASVALLLQQSAFVANETPYNILVQRNSVFWPPGPAQQFTQNMGAVIANMGLPAVTPPLPPGPETRVFLYRRHRFSNPTVVMQ